MITQPEDELYRLLASLQHKEFLYEQPAFPEVEYIFKHALTQEVAYGTVLHERRKVLHERTAQALETLYVATLDEHYSDLAHHYSRSANAEKAITYLYLAGQQAVQRSANTEAITHFTTALELLKTCRDLLSVHSRSLFLQTTLGPALMATKGYAAPEVGKTYARARELCQQVGETPQLFSMLYGLRSISSSCGQNYRRRVSCGSRPSVWLKNIQEQALLVEAYSSAGSRFVPSWRVCSQPRSTLEQGITFYEPSAAPFSRLSQ